ncbi:NAD(P)-dependent alcohol dehydrogenase [Streptomyces sp. NPDC001828]|uniref:NAD(P)-dependent alcohol dehydrogenase n=1 Tax=Streptomyces sp. NPDC001828 TaxID=3364615 RepID=UPI0036919897
MTGIETTAYAAAASAAPLQPTTITRRPLGEHDVLIDIQYCGVCHSDIHQARDEWGESIFPMVPGHEITGLVSAVGSAVTRYSPGDRAGVGCFVDSCRTCAHCRKGQEQYCSSGLVFTYNDRDADGRPTDGGYAGCIVVDENYILTIPDTLPLDQAAPLLCAGITVYAPLRQWNVGPGTRLAVLGMGGLGHLAVKIGHALGADVSVLSRTPDKEKDARAYGAKDFIVTGTSGELDRHQGAFDVLISTVSAPLDLDPYLNTLATDGTFVCVGLPEAVAAVDLHTLVHGRRKIAGSMIGGIAETQEMLDFCAAHRITADIETIPAQQINEAFERTLTSDVHYRFVIDTHHL